MDQKKEILKLFIHTQYSMYVPYPQRNSIAFLYTINKWLENKTSKP